MPAKSAPYQVSYISAACNHVPGVVDWGNNNLICYGSCNAVLIYDPNIGGGKIISTLSQHTGRVNSVRWIHSAQYETELISTGADKKAIVWTFKDGSYEPKVLSGYDDVVTVGDGIYKDEKHKHLVVVTGSADCKIKIWERKSAEEDFALKQEIVDDYNICISLRVFLLHSNVIFACGDNRSRILLYKETADDYKLACTLLGQEDWVRGLDFSDKGDEILLASSSQDHFVRIWRIVKKTEENKQVTFKQQFDCGENSYGIVLETILAGHEGWVYSVNWCQGKLLSASIDKSMIIWEYNDDADIWMESERLGGIGGNTLGFYGGMFDKSGNYLLGHGYHGAFHLWKFDEEVFSWEPQVTIGGHFNEVTNLAWDPLGNYLMSVSYDQTTRIHGPWRKTDDSPITWHEVARPQIHGFDIACLAIIDHYRFASGAEEKIVRTFQAPRNFVDNFQRICNVNDQTNYVAPKGAAVPSLGLSNKAIFANDNAEKATVTNKKEIYPEESYFTAVTLTEPPTEENLMQNTLWPETQKLYGHGYELYSIAASPDAKLIASSCKATTAEHAAILLWETQTWQIVQKLMSHTLTIAQLAFSPDSQHILSVSRDRRWSLFTKNQQSDQFELAASTGRDKGTAVHTRIIWCCAWSADSKYFSTGSRDGKVAVWYKSDQDTQTTLGPYKLASNILQLNKESVTALAFAPKQISKGYLLAVGLETGLLLLYKWNIDGFLKLTVLDHSVAHHLTVKRLAFRPVCLNAAVTSGSSDTDGKNVCQLASCSADSSVRIYDFDMDSL